MSFQKIYKLFFMKNKKWCRDTAVGKHCIKPLGSDFPLINQES